MCFDFSCCSSSSSQVHVSKTARTHQSSAVKRRKDAESRFSVVQEQLESLRITNERLMSSHRSSSEQEELVLRLEEDKSKLEVRIYLKIKIKNCLLLSALPGSN